MIDGAIQDFPLTLDRILDHGAKWHPDIVVATAHDGGIAHVGYADLRDNARRASSVLRSFGVMPGDRVATLAWNTQQHVEAWFAIMGMGAVCHTLNPRLTTPQLVSMIDQSEARILIASADLLPQALGIARDARQIERVLVIDGDDPLPRGEGVAIDPFGPLICMAEPTIPWGDFDERTPSGLCFTSGSTGAPKGVTYTHRGSFLHTLRLLQADVLGLTTVDALMPVVPMFHANAWGLPFAAPAAGAKLVLPGRKLDGASLASLIQAEEVTIAVGVPTVFLGLCEHLEATGERLPSLQRITVGGAPMPPALMERIERQLGISVQTSWGMTELSPVGTFAVLSDPDRRAAKSGKPAIGIDLMLADRDGTPLVQQRETEGRLHVRGSAVIERYFGHTEPATDAEGWFDTGDLAKIDRGGNLIITGRAKDLIKSGGEWINPAEIEAVVGALPQVALAAVIGRADDKWGERPLLLVELRDDHAISDDDVIAALRGRVASWWLPDTIVRLAAMPLAPTGKIDKLSLRRDHGGF
jgi:3-(methylthio)propionyl---CoA ligase